ncbi:DUF998 domain-containing protein [Microbispora sp. NPDC049125]|uniref:DUF998 domain-containing protein n=1 Tax=Microbispora sp. NPDC049125 TaxID=3154929 RepID=UPI003467CF2D
MTRSPQGPRGASLLAGTSLAGCTAFILAVAALHVVQSRLDPVAVTISEYVLGPAGWLFTLACISLAIASLAQVALLAAMRPVPSRAGLLLLAIWAAGMFLVAAFPTDPIDRQARVVHLSAQGLVHAVAGQVAFLCFGAAVLLITRGLRRHTPTGPTIRAVRICAVLSLAGLAFALGVTALGLFGLFGLAERLMLPAYIGWLACTTVYAHSVAAADTERPAGNADAPSR